MNRPEHAPRARWLRAAALPVLVLLGAALPAAPGVSSPRYPADLCIDPAGRWLFTANEASGSVSMLSLASGVVVEELVLGPAGRPSAIAMDPRAGDAVRLAVCETFEHRVTVLTVAPENAEEEAKSSRPRLEVSRRLAVGRLPSDLCFTAAGRLLVACEGLGEVWELDLEEGRVARRLAAVEGVRRLALDSAPRTGAPPLLAVAGRTEVAKLRLDTGKLIWRKRPAEEKAFNLDGLAMVDGRVFVAHQIRPTESAIDPQMIVWGLIIANRLSILPPLAYESPLLTQPQESDAQAQVVSLDSHRAAGDPTAVEILPARKGREGAPVVLVASGGTDRLLLVDTGADSAAYGALRRYQPLRTIRVGDRPVAMALADEGRRVYVACYLDDTVVEVDLEERRVKRTLALGPHPETEQQAGARIFYDANRSRGGWYSCNSCHPGGGTRGHLFDTPSDGDGLAKKSPDLRGTTLTGPWSWLGRFEVLEQQVASSLKQTMAVDHPPRDEEIEQVIAFLDTLKRPLPSSSPDDPGGDPALGRELFQRSGCERCHRPPTFTTRETRDVGVDDPYPDRHNLYNPPSLLGLRDRYRYLHDGRADSLWAVFREHNAAGKHGKADQLSDGELRDLIAFLKTL